MDKQTDKQTGQNYLLNSSDPFSSLTPFLLPFLLRMTIFAAPDGTEKVGTEKVSGTESVFRS